MIDFDSYADLMPLVVEWLLEVETMILDNGRELTPSELQDARAVGVNVPENIRILAVRQIAQPEHPALRAAGKETGLLAENVSGRTVGYGVEVIEGHISRRLLRHEFRHVYQFEQAGSRASFITDYIKSVFTEGYTDSVYERDARAFEGSCD